MESPHLIQKKRTATREWKKQYNLAKGIYSEVFSSFSSLNREMACNTFVLQSTQPVYATICCNIVST